MSMHPGKGKEVKREKGEWERGTVRGKRGRGSVVHKFRRF
jgi:hypothetical protein